MHQLTLEESKALSRKTGLFVVCASCPRMWEGMALGKESCTGNDCGSPVRRKDFPEYAGSLKDLASICIVCGEEDVLVYAKLAGSDKKMGLCRAHIEVIDDNAAPTNGKIVGDEEKILIFPNPAKVKEEYRNAKHEL